MNDVVSIIQPKYPSKKKQWLKFKSIPHWATLGYAGEGWIHKSTGLSVISAVEVAEDKDHIDIGPHYHISISKNGSRCSRAEAQFVLKAFDLQDAEEDNHVPNGIVRNFFMPVAEKYIGRTCPCKDEEPAMIEDKGDYVWRGVSQ